MKVNRYSVTCGTIPNRLANLKSQKKGGSRKNFEEIMVKIFIIVVFIIKDCHLHNMTAMWENYFPGII